MWNVDWNLTWLRVRLDLLISSSLLLWALDSAELLTERLKIERLSFFASAFKKWVTSMRLLEAIFAEPEASPMITILN